MQQFINDTAVIFCSTVFCALQQLYLLRKSLSVTSLMTAIEQVLSCDNACYAPSKSEWLFLSVQMKFEGGDLQCHLWDNKEESTDLYKSRLSEKESLRRAIISVCKRLLLV